MPILYENLTDEQKKSKNLTSYDKNYDEYVARDLPEVKIKGDDLRIAKATRDGMNKFGTDYMYPAVKAAASFSPIAPALGIADAWHAYNTGDDASAYFNAGMEALPGSVKLVSKMNKFRKPAYKAIKYALEGSKKHKNVSDKILKTHSTVQNFRSADVVAEAAFDGVYN